MDSSSSCYKAPRRRGSNNRGHVRNETTAATTKSPSPPRHGSRSGLRSRRENESGTAFSKSSRPTNRSSSMSAVRVDEFESSRTLLVTSTPRRPHRMTTRREPLFSGSGRSTPRVERSSFRKALVLSWRKSPSNALDGLPSPYPVANFESRGRSDTVVHSLTPPASSTATTSRSRATTTVASRPRSCRVRRRFHDASGRRSGRGG